MSNILVTGGAGYIGSHVGKLLGRAGHTLITLDNLTKGRRDAVLFGELVVGDTGDRELVSELLGDHDIDTAKVFDCSVSETAQVLRSGDVAGDREGFATGFRDAPGSIVDGARAVLKER